eukprot:Pompholyxophrys_punicea_v1_NODE_95_length_3532_cov_6.599080.p2 type:complete len:152 gc:universal NODE_95_length_3532_cov_6.599080:1669-1214(-)
MIYWGSNSKGTRDWHKERVLNKQDEMFITLFILRLGVPQTLIADLCGISQSYVSKIFTTWIALLFWHLADLPWWPSRESVKKNHKFSKMLILNVGSSSMGPNFFIPVPKHTKSHKDRQTYSDYKSHNNLKALLRITPDGLFSFVSESWSEW